MATLHAHTHTYRIHGTAVFLEHHVHLALDVSWLKSDRLLGVLDLVVQRVALMVGRLEHEWLLVMQRSAIRWRFVALNRRTMVRSVKPQWSVCYRHISISRVGKELLT